MPRPKNDKPLTREQKLERYGAGYDESVGQWDDAGDLDRFYEVHTARKKLNRPGGLSHYAAKIDGYEQVMGREYPYFRPGPPSDRDRMLTQRGVNEILAGEHPQLLARIKELEAAKQTRKEGPLALMPDARMAGIALAGLLGAGGIGYAIAANQQSRQDPNQFS